MTPYLSLILPAFNEVESLPRVIESCTRLSDRLETGTLEVVVVDDGSTDGTGEYLKGAAIEHSWLRLLTHGTNRGYGAALRSGFLAARGGVVAYTDADNQFDIGEFADHLHLIDKADLVAGFRVYRFDPLPRLVVSWVYNRLVRVLFRVPIRDVDCSFKMMRREKLDRLVLLCDDFFIDTELVARASKWNWSICEVGVRHYPRTAGRTTVKPGDIPRTLRIVARMWFAIHYPNRAEHARNLTDQEAARRAARES